MDEKKEEELLLTSASHYFKNDSQSVFDQFVKSDNTPTISNINTVRQDSFQENISVTDKSPSYGALINSTTASGTLILQPSSDNKRTSILSNFTDEVFRPSFCTSGPSFFNSSEEDHIYDSWIPSQSTQEILKSLASLPTGSFKVEKEYLVTPCIAVKEPFDDPIASMLTSLGLEAVQQRSLNLSNVTQDDNGLRQLIANGYYYSALNLTTHLLSIYGQGDMKSGQICKHTAHSIQLWFTRIALLVKLRRFSMAEVECEAFGDLESPDLYFEFYSELYIGRKGSMVPFSFRLLVAELPQYLGKHMESLNRLSKLMSACEKIIGNISNGYNEDGTEAKSKSNAAKSLRVWNSRLHRTLYSLTRCAVSLKDFRLANSLIDRLFREVEGESAGLFAALGRLCLHLGDISSAKEAFKRHLEYTPSGEKYDPVQGMIHSALVAGAQSDFTNAVDILKQALKISPTNALIINNLGVCLIFAGRIREAIELVRESILAHPNQLLHEALVLNLSTMYDLESSRSQNKKMELLSLIAKHKGDGFNTAALKLQVS